MSSFKREEREGERGERDREEQNIIQIKKTSFLKLSLNHF